MKLNEWLTETRKLNLDLKKLAKHINDGHLTPFFIYEGLKGEDPFIKAKILFKQWNSEVIESSPLIVQCL